MWANAHHIYHPTAGRNAYLFQRNSFFSEIRSSRKLRFLHVTKNKAKIEETQELHASSGCLVGSVYCTPVMEDPRGLRLHNLGSYYYNREAPASLLSRGQTDKKPYALLIELELNKPTGAILEGIDYLKLGQVHNNIFHKLSHLLTRQERLEIEEMILEKITDSLSFVNRIREITCLGSSFNPTFDFQALRQSIPNIPILGYAYFEALSRTLMLHQCDEDSCRYAEYGEFHNAPYKEMMFSLYPAFFNDFNLSFFNPEPEVFRS